MRRMSGYFLILAVALAICAWLARRQERSAFPANRPMDRLQEGVRIERSGPYGADEAAKRRLREKLADQERRQRPGEGRN